MKYKKAMSLYRSTLIAALNDNYHIIGHSPLSCAVLTSRQIKIIDERIKLEINKDVK